ncbi:ComEC/Rec2 family competence protein [Geomonas propionica]|uniref:MBL fold metallo-hydrolase n=1 Tax=Geomonas propionica TaxID=2798582 RepID=A0ABS0YKS0_9BACT|nr:MBL fold metallo-hydrolase [Geomonas propionica]MBJ6798544.1 MBL fold metallo-hydrolase [Geomonas propionica]
MHKLIVMDVGHGNSTILVDSGGAMVIDAPSGATLMEALEQLAVKELAYIFVSHPDADHIGGLTNLLLNQDITVRRVFINQEKAKNSKAWTDFRVAAGDARRRGTEIHTELTTTLSKKLGCGEVEVEILSPFPENVLGGVGEKLLEGKTIQQNTMSVVIKIVYKGVPIALIPGDMDASALDYMLKEGADVTAAMLVYPHHGGHCKADNEAFVKSLTEAVNPSIVVFSMERGRYDNPQPTVVKSVKEAAPDAHIICTQLSMRCSAELPSGTPSHLLAFPSKGVACNYCCGGTVVIDLDTDMADLKKVFSRHSKFVAERITSPLCRA